jgi:hypothetical protein
MSLTQEIDYEQPDLIEPALRAQSLVGQTVTARVHGPMDPNPVVGVVESWSYEPFGVTVVVDDGVRQVEVWQHDALPATPEPRSAK